MKSLVLKDLFNILHNMKSLFLMLLFFLFIFIPTSGPEGYIFVSCFLCSTIIVTTFSFDTMTNWTKYAMIMPITKKEIVMSKFIVAFLFSAYGALNGFIFGTIGGIITGKIAITNIHQIIINLILAGIGLSITLIFSGLMIPLLIKYGAEKARMLMLAAYVIPSCILLGIFQLLEVMGIKLTQGMIIGLLCSLPVIAIVWYYIMYQISFKIFDKKELLY